MLRYALRSLAARPRRAGMTAIAVVVGVAMITGTLVLTDTIDAAFRQLFTNTAAGAQLVVASKQELSASPALQTPASVPAALVQRIRALPDVAAAEGQIRDLATIIGRDGATVRSAGLPTEAVSYVPPPFSGIRVTAGHQPSGPHQVAIDASLAGSGGYRVGEQIGVVTGEPLRRFTISGIVRIGDSAPAGAAFVVFDLPTAATLYAKSGLVDRVYITGLANATRGSLIRQIEPLLPAELIVRPTAQQVDSDMGQISSQLTLVRTSLLAFALVAVLVGAFVIVGSIFTTVAQRTRELALLRALGATRVQIGLMVMAEASVCALLASLLGVAGGVLAAAAARGLLGLSGLQPAGTGLVLAGRTVAVGVGVGVAVAVAAALVPAIRAARVPPLEALRLADARRSPGRLRVLERAIRAVAAPLTGRRSILGRLATENAARNPARTVISASSLMIGLAAVLVVTIYASGLRASTQRTVGRTFLGDFTIQSQDGTSPMPAAVARAVAETPGIELAASVKAAPARVGRVITTAEGFDPATIGELYRFGWARNAAASLPDLGPGDAVLERGTAQAARVGVGDTVTVTSETGARASFTVRGIYDDHALLRGIALPIAGFDGLFHQSRLQDVFVKLAPGASRELAQASLASALRTFPGVVVRSEPQLADALARRVGSILVLFYALLAVSIGVSLLGIVNTLMLSIHERTRELGVLRAFGMTPAQLSALIRRESAVTAALGALLGLLAGLLVAWVLIRLQAGDGLVFAAPWTLVAVVLALGLLAPLLASTAPARRAARLDVLDAIAEE